MGVGLSFEPPALSIGSIDFDDADVFTLEVAGQPGTRGPGPFDADQLEGAEVAQPAQQLLVAGLGRGEALDAEQGPSVVQSRSYMDVEVRIDPAGDTPGQLVTVIASLVWVGDDTAPSGTTDKTARAC